MTLTEALAVMSTKVSEQGTVIESAITLMGGLSAQLAALQASPEALQSIIDQLEAQKAALQAGVTANTPPAV